jgi:hypothetical protein
MRFFFMILMRMNSMKQTNGGQREEHLLAYYLGWKEMAEMDGDCHGSIYKLVLNVY